MPPVTVRVRPFVVLDRFEFDRSLLRPFHLPMIVRVAQRVVASWQTASPVRNIRLVGHADQAGQESYNVNLGQQRALAVQARLVQEIDRLRPGLSQQLNIVPQSLGETRPATRDRTAQGRARNRRVEVFLSTVVTAQPSQASASPGPAQTSAPSRPVRIPTPEEAARTVVRMGPETPEERIQRILRTPMPSPRMRRTFSEAFRQRLDERLNPVMSRLPSSLRGPIRALVHAAIRRGSEELLNRGLEASGLPGEVQEAIRGIVRAGGGLTVP